MDGGDGVGSVGMELPLIDVQPDADYGMGY